MATTSLLALFHHRITFPLFFLYHLERRRRERQQLAPEERPPDPDAQCCPQKLHVDPRGHEQPDQRLSQQARLLRLQLEDRGERLELVPHNFVQFLCFHPLVDDKARLAPAFGQLLHHFVAFRRASPSWGSR